MKLKNTCFFNIFVCQNFQLCEFDSVFHGLGSSEYGCCCFLWPGYGIKLQNEPWGSSLRAVFTVWQHGLQNLLFVSNKCCGTGNGISDELMSWFWKGS